MDKHNKVSFSSTHLLLAILFGILVGMLLFPPSHSRRDARSLTKLDEAMELIEHYYVEDMDRDTLTEQMIEAMLATLDPHSRYLSGDELRHETEQIQGGFEGIGVVLHYEGDTACVGQLIAGGPAEKAGLLPGDRLMMCDTVKLSGVGMSNEEVVKHLRGRHHSRAKIAVKRYGEEGLRHFTVVRDLIGTPSLSYSGMIDAQTGYIRLTRFCETSHEEFCTAVKELKREGMKRLIFDLRDNGGGLLSAAIDIADELLPGKELIVYTSGDNQRRQNVHSNRGGLFCEGELAVMINEYSASASEVVTGAIQDNDRGVVVGRRSFGKGLVQRQFDLNDGSAIWLTIARYYTPSGRCIQRPYDKGNDEYYTDFLKQMMVKNLSDSSLMQITDSTEYHTAAGRVVYGGGGIYPDKALPLRTDSLYTYYNLLFNKQVIGRYSFGIITRHYNELKKKYPTREGFLKKYQVTDHMMQEMYALGDQMGVRRNPRTIARYGEEIRQMVKGTIGESLFDMKIFYRTILDTDREVKETLAFMNKKGTAKK
ncbi:MAG: S41 family peptidase [Bacteroidales bacterium]|nr:S41 family peptidase [Bacteroidales bacterium]